MPEPVRMAIHIASFIGCYAAVFGVAALVQRLKRDSPQWQDRSVRERRVLARLAGLIVALALYAVILFLIPLG